ncbi:MAG TPA: bifunctional biotin--[acetyl-CoA-carboxylase] ligase/biotin operon repressor BirA [Hyphomicrobiales bacterium]|nr:bifunctional biotin--[acetyl-CoA-carboxylase] ligase/biotin operon repressor BirA [Hyphomicrobiales bacterium]
MQALATQLIGVLADGQFHTGAALGARFGVSKTSIWKAVGALDELGLEVHCVRGKGYRLSERLHLLSAGAIGAALRADVAARLARIDILPEIDSTNSQLLRQVQAGDVEADPALLRVCLAERQSAGRGRRGRGWVSPFGSNIYLSLLAVFEGGAAALGGLSLAVGIAVAEALQARGLGGVGLKWPNDLLCEGRKIGGVLLEISGDLQSRCHVVIGVGLNLRARVDDMQQVTQPWTDLAAYGIAPQARNALVAALLNALVDAVALFRERGFAAFLTRWEALDLGYAQPLDVFEGEAVVTGTGQGVDASGALLVATPQGLRRFHGGEISLRLREQGGSGSKGVSTT